MVKSFLKLAEIKLVLKHKGLNYKLKDRKINDSDGNYLTFFDVRNRTQIRGKIVRAFNEGEVYHWPLLSHQNLAPLIDVLYIRDDLSIFLTTDHQVTLKEIIHDEDFVYDRRCLDRKRLYAKGIYSGLSYLHGKSLCLMNLTDDNIAISKIYDKAVITNFSCLVCSRKTTRSKMRVPEVYKSPESDKGEFDAIGAEMWASGILMLDLFLAHMVPWAIVDYKPKRVMEVVEKLSLELLQAANVGAVVTCVDLAKYKAFLKCFFKPNSVARINARIASFASFLHPNLQDNTLWSDPVGKTVYPTTNLATPNVEKEHFISNNFNLGYLPVQSPSIDGISHESLALKYSDSKNCCKDLTEYCKQPGISKCKSYNSTLDIPCLPEVNGRVSPVEGADTVAEAVDSKRIKEQMFKEINDEIAASKGTTSVTTSSYRQEERNQMVKFRSPFFNETNDSFTDSQTNVAFGNTSKSPRMVTDEKAEFNGSNYICYQSKSLPFIKSKHNDNAAPSEFCSRRTLSYSSVRSTSIKQSNTYDSRKSELCLNRLIEESKLPEAEMSKARDQNALQLRTRDVRGTTKSREHFLYSHGIYPSVDDSQKQPASKSVSLHRSDINQSGLLKEQDVSEMWNKIKSIRYLQITLRKHSRISISAEFNSKQQKLLLAYERLLHEEFLRLCRILEGKYQLKIEDLVELDRYLNSVFENPGNQQEALPQSRNKNISYKACQNKLLKSEKRKDIQGNVGNTKNYINANKVTPGIRVRRKYSYCRAIEISNINADRKRKIDEANGRLEQAPSVFFKQNNPKDQFIVSVTDLDKQPLKVMVRKHKLEDAMIQPETFDRMEENGKGSSKCRKERISKKKTEKNANKEKKDKAEINDKKEKEHKTEKNDKKLKIEKSEKKEQKDKKEKCPKKEKIDKKLPKPKREREVKSSFFLSLCPRGRIEESSPILDNFCETCKLNLEMP